MASRNFELEFSLFSEVFYKISAFIDWSFLKSRSICSDFSLFSSKSITINSEFYLDLLEKVEFKTLCSFSSWSFSILCFSWSILPSELVIFSGICSLICLSWLIFYCRIFIFLIRRFFRKAWISWRVFFREFSVVFCSISSLRIVSYFISDFEECFLFEISVFS